MILELNIDDDLRIPIEVSMVFGYKYQRYLTVQTGQALTIDTYGRVYNVGNWAEERRPVLIGTNGVVRHE